MEWNDFCIKIDSMGRFFRDKLHFEYNDEQINYKISEQDYVYTKNDFNTLKNNAEHFSFQPFSILNNYQYESLVDFPDGESRRPVSYTHLDVYKRQTLTSCRPTGIRRNCSP